jgi:hypothetical protein
MKAAQAFCHLDSPEIAQGGTVMALLEFLAEMTFELIGGIAESAFLHSFGRSKRKSDGQVTKQVCRRCQQPGKVKQTNADWYLYECQACQMEWTSHRRRNIRQPGRSGFFRKR